MGFNLDNIFIQNTNQEKILEILPLVIPDEVWKVAISSPKDNWIQLVDSHRNTPPELAQKLSKELSCIVVCVQISEATGDAGWFIYNNGNNLEIRETGESIDPYGEVIAILHKYGVHKPELMLFQWVIKDPDWKIKQQK